MVVQLKYKCNSSKIIPAISDKDKAWWIFFANTQDCFLVDLGGSCMSSRSKQLVKVKFHVP